MRNFLFGKYFKLLSVLFLFSIISLKSQNKLDSINELKEIVVTAKTFKEVIPAQKLEGKALKELSSSSVADAIRYFSGVQIKDYGGIGGIKTVNIRSMGTNQTGVFYDGIQLGNAQNGQIDLGKFSLDNMEEISLYNGQKSEIFQPAKDYGSSGSIYLRSRTPKFEKDKIYNFKATVKTGSFDLINPSILYERKISNNINTSLNAEVINASGKYKYRYKRVYPGTDITKYDTTAIRQNGDVFSLRLEGGLYGTINQGYWKVKTYYYDSNRGIPGAIISNVWKNSQRQKDRNFFTQGTFEKNITDKYAIQANMKYAYDYMYYLNPDTASLIIENTFRQEETYISLANKYAITDKWDISLSSDFQYNTLRSNMRDFVYPKRTTGLVALASSLEFYKFKMQGSILSTFIHDKTKNKRSAESKNKVVSHREKFTPAFFISYKPFEDHNLSIRAFYKNIFRMPTFNDLYYTDILVSDLKPEFAHQYNLGLHYQKSFADGLLNQFQIQSDVYYNKITDKIVAIPKGNGQYRWTMLNIGKVEIRGIETSATSVFIFPHEVLLNLKLSYTYQKAQNFARRKSEEFNESTYKGQIPYIPWHSGSAIANISYKRWHLNYSFVYIGERYSSSANTRPYYVQPWYTHDVSVIKDFRFQNTNMRVSAEVNNLLSQDYEVIINYPMPKRNYKISLTIEI